jgi:ketosteroid isomerase-like protein
MDITDTRTVAATYFRAWKERDFTTLRGILADDATFRGPLGTADDGDACVAGLRGMAQILERVDVTRRWVDGDDVITWFDLHTTVAEPLPVVNWSRVRGGRIAEVRVTFDPRPLIKDG